MAKYPEKEPLQTEFRLFSELVKNEPSLLAREVSGNYSSKMTIGQRVLAEELYKAHFVPAEVTKLLPFGYGCIHLLWKRFEYANVKKYNRLTLTALFKGENLANAHSE